MADSGAPRGRILLVGRGPPDRGGISAFLQALLDGALPSGFDVHLLNLTPKEVPRSGRLTKSNVARTLADARSVWRAARHEDLVHIHTALAPHVTMIRAGVLASMAKLRRCKTIVHVHGGRVALWLTSWPRRLLARICLAPADRVVAVSSGVGNILAKSLGPDRVVVLGNGVDVGAFGPPGPPNDPPRILYAGVLTPRKGVIDLFRASELLLRRGIGHEVIMVGGTPDEGPEAEAKVRGAATGAVRFRGPQPHEAMPAVYRAADVFCLPSWWEAMPLSLLEAMATGLPVVATTVGDVPRVVEPNVTGQLVPPRNPGALAQALEPLLRDPSLRAAMGSAGRRRVEAGLTLRHTTDAVAALYGAVLASE
jgi:D-inositol-3-phosphate glycosyltransferase